MGSNLENLTQQLTAQPARSDHQIAAANALLDDCGRSFIQSAIQQPVIAVRQLADRVTGGHAAEQVAIVKTPTEHARGSAAYYLEEISSAAGAAVPFVVAALAVRPLTTKLVGETLFAGGMSAVKASSLAGLSESATAGFVSGAVFTPSQNVKSFWHERLNNGLVSTASMTSMHIMAHGLAQVTGAHAAGASVLARTLNTAAAGSGAGVVGAETSALLTTGQLASASDIKHSAIDSAVIGGALGAAGEHFSRLTEKRSNYPLLEDYTTRVYSNQRGENYCSHYLGFRSQHSTFDWLKLVGKEVPKEIKDTGEKHLQIADWSPLERSRLLAQLERDGRSPLVKAEAMNAFVDKMIVTGKEWHSDKLSTLAMQRDISFKNYSQSMTSNKREQEGYRQMLSQLTDPALREKAQGKLDDLVKERERLEDLDRSYDGRFKDVVSRREKDLLAVVNGFLESQKLPAATLVIEDSSATAASYNRGRVKVKTSMASDGEISPKLICAVYHELVHLEQDTLRIRNIADRLKIGRTAGDADMARLMQMAYPQLKAYDTPLSHTQNAEATQFVQRILVVRDGRPLTWAEKNRAESLAVAQNTYKYPGLDDMVAIRDKRLMIREGLGPTTPERSLAMILNHHQKVGFDAVPEGLKPLGGKESLNEAEVKMVKATILDRLDELRAAYETHNQAKYHWYMSNGLEREAYPVGLLAFLLTNAKKHEQQKEN